MPLKSALRPQGLNGLPPSTHPKLAFKAGTTGFTDMPDEGFLAPPWEPAALTRILRRCLIFNVSKFCGKIQ